MAEGKICVCPQCGKKYKLREGFDAASFSCKACGATVWVSGKPSAPSRSAAPKTRRARAHAGRSRGGGRAGKRGGARGAAPARGRRGRGREEPAEEAEEGRRGRYSSKQASPANKIIAIVGLVGIVAVGIFLLSTTGKKEQSKQEEASRTVEQPATEPGVNPSPENPAPAPADAGGESEPATEPDTAIPEDAGGPAEPEDRGSKERPAAGDAGTKPSRRLGGSKKTTGRSGGRRKYDPPPDIPHLESTPPALRKQIDELIATMMDPLAGIDSNRAKAKLVAIGKPAFPRVLGAMAKIRDTIGDEDTQEERNLESSLMLGDQALREMDGYLESYHKGLIRPGTDKKYIEYILYLHYKRWVTKLSQMDEMPGPYDPTKEYTEEAPEDQ